jgi:DNA repair protein RecO (recombination protein O)
MEWTEDGIVLGARKHGESAAIVTMLTRDHGRHAGLVRGGAGRRARGVYQPGNRVRAHWSARLAEHLGTFRCELLRPHAADYLHDPLRLLALSTATAMADSVMPEREPHPLVFDRLAGLMERLGGDDWPAAYVRWEYMLLGELGFALDVGNVGDTGAGAGRALFVSAYSGEAVADGDGDADGDADGDGDGDGDHGERRLKLPAFLLSDPLSDDETPPASGEIGAGLALTGHFLNQRVFHPERRTLPATRTRLVNGLQ